MKMWRRVWGAAALLLAAVSVAQAQATVLGEVINYEGKPFANVTVILKSDDVGTTYELKTDRAGQFVQAGLRTGVYSITLKAGEQVIMQGYQTRVVSGDNNVVLNLKEMKEKQEKEHTAVAAERKKQEEEQGKFSAMKSHFEAGIMALNEAKQVGSQIPRTPAAERAPLQERYAQLSQTAATEFEAAQKAAPAKDPNLHTVMANLAQAYEGSGKYAEAAAAYEKAVALKPEPGYFLGMGTSLARAGKLEEAGAACDKVGAMDKNMAATCWRNIGIVFYNANDMGKAVGPLRKATELEPNHAQTWYLLGAALVNTMTSKMEGSKVIPILQPGTVEAYQKCTEIDPNGLYGQQCKQGLEQLQAMGVGIETKLKGKKK